MEDDVLIKVAEFIKKLNEIGYDENTELTFSCVDGDTGECYELKFDEFSYGESLTGQPYCNDVIDISVDVDANKDYIKAKASNFINDLAEELNDVIKKYS